MSALPETSVPSEAIVAPIPPVAKLSIRQYDRMIDAGVFACEPRQQVELLEGVLRRMTPIGHEHENAVDWLTRWSIENTHAREVRVRIQESLSLPGQASVPEPDVVWVRKAPYTKGRPTADDVLLVMEVAKSSLNIDLGSKAILYAEAGVADYWVVDITAESLVIHRDPKDGRYNNIETHRGSQQVETLASPNASLTVRSIFDAS